MSDPVMFNCRFPSGVREAARVSAWRNRRSMTAELIHMLSLEPSGPLPEDMEAVGARSGYQFGLRLPRELHETLQDQARRSGRSMQGEVLYRVISALTGEGTTPSVPNDEKVASRSKAFTITVRLTADQRARLEAASTLGPYRVALTEIIARGIELAAQELEQMAERAKAGAS